MNRAFVAGILFVSVGLLLYVLQYIGEWICAHSPTPTLCVSTEGQRLLFDYPLIAIGVVLVAYSLLGPRLRLPKD